MYRTIFGLFLIGILLSVTSCKDECEKKNCLNGAICDDGECLCLTSFYGPDCSTPTRQAIEALYQTEVRCSNQPPLTGVVSNVFYLKSEKEDFFYIGQYHCRFTDKLKFEILPTTIDGGKEVTGEGEFSAALSSLTYTTKIVDGSSTESCTFTAKK